MGASWTEFYKGRVLSKSYREYAASRYAPFTDAIVSRIKPGDRVVEIGCGLATITSIIAEGSRPFCGFRCYDVNPEMVGLASLNLSEAGYPVEVADARTPTWCKPDIIHSHGMLEHFSDKDICDVIEAGIADGARWSIHYVPGEKYEKPSFGDERLMSLAEWDRIAAPTESFTFNDGYDHCLVWDLTKW